MPSDQTHTPNRLLSALSNYDRGRLTPHLERLPIQREQVLVTPNKRIDCIYFLESGIASITSGSAGDGLTEVGIFGHEGVSGTALLLGADRSPHETFIQVGDGYGSRIDAAKFMEIVEDSPTLRRTMLRYVQTLMVQMAQSAVANSRAQIEARLARWLLMCHDRVEGDDIALTHEFMGIMIGANRSGVTIALHVLEGTGTIRSTRGKVTVLDRGKLEELAGEIYGEAENEYRRLIGPNGKDATRPT